MCDFEPANIYEVGQIVTFPNEEKRVATCSQHGAMPYDCSKVYSTGMFCEYHGTVFMSNGLASGPEPFNPDHWVIPPFAFNHSSQNKKSML